MMKLQQLIAVKRQQDVCSPFVVAELDFIHAWCELFDDRADLARREISKSRL
jgi:hypothetical protein